jgi:glycosyltransferase involved in cell wall biosynthesis
MLELAIAIPYYNGEKYLAETLQSIKAQSFADYQIYIFDDASPRPMSAALLDCIRKSGAIVRRNAENLGSLNNIKQIMQYPFAEPFLCVFHQDDIMHPKMLEWEIQCFKKNPNLSFVAGSLRYVTKTGPDLFGQEDYSAAKIYNTSRELTRAFLRHLRLCFSSVIYRRELLAKHLSDFEFEKFSIIFDRPFLVHLSEFAPAVFLPAPLVAYRVHLEQDSATGPLREENFQALTDYYYQQISPFQNKREEKDFRAFVALAALGSFLKQRLSIAEIRRRLKDRKIKLTDLGLRGWLILLCSHWLPQLRRSCANKKNN